MELHIDARSFKRPEEASGNQRRESAKKYVLGLGIKKESVVHLPMRACRKCALIYILYTRAAGIGVFPVAARASNPQGKGSPRQLLAPAANLEHICADKTNRLSRVSRQRPFLSGTLRGGRRGGGVAQRGEEKTVPLRRSEIEIALANIVTSVLAR